MKNRRTASEVERKRLARLGTTDWLASSERIDPRRFVGFVGLLWHSWDLEPSLKPSNPMGGMLRGRQSRRYLERAAQTASDELGIRRVIVLAQALRHHPEWTNEQARWAGYQFLATALGDFPLECLDDLGDVLLTSSVSEVEDAIVERLGDAMLAEPMDADE